MSGTRKLLSEIKIIQLNILTALFVRAVFFTPRLHSQYLLLIRHKC